MSTSFQATRGFSIVTASLPQTFLNPLSSSVLLSLFANHSPTVSRSTGLPTLVTEHLNNRNSRVILLSKNHMHQLMLDWEGFACETLHKFSQQDLQRKHCSTQTHCVVSSADLRNNWFVGQLTPDKRLNKNIKHLSECSPLVSNLFCLNGVRYFHSCLEPCKDVGNMSRSRKSRCGCA